MNLLICIYAVCKKNIITFFFIFGAVSVNQPYHVYPGSSSANQLVGLIPIYNIESAETRGFLSLEEPLNSIG